ncbi:MAG: DUF4336 domain-containing protein [Pseudomonadales bacterium]|nr:DUF4336 domain-containing protein [Pseudomonadales bacterium]
MTYLLEEYVKEKIYIVEYPLRFAGMDIFSRMTIVKLDNGQLWVHSPSEIDEELKEAIDSLGEVGYIIAPGNFHHLNVANAQSLYPNAETFLCPGLEKKRPDLTFDWILGNRPDPRWGSEFEQVVILGTRIINEVAFLHVATKTLILVDLIENIGDEYEEDAGLLLKFWWKAVFHMWNNPKAAPEYQMAWGDKEVVKKALNKILAWDFERIIIAHGSLIDDEAKAVAQKAWRKVLRHTN